MKSVSNVVNINVSICLLSNSAWDGGRVLVAAVKRPWSRGERGFCTPAS